MVDKMIPCRNVQNSVKPLLHNYAREALAEQKQSALQEQIVAIS